MKKFLSISFAFLILLSGMHLSIATHICGGEVAAVKWSFSGEKATCGMESSNQSCTERDSIASNCCKNKLSVYAVDNNYTPSSFQINEVTKYLLQVFGFPVNIFFNSSLAAICLRNDPISPDSALVSAVSLEENCIFRI